MRHFIQSRGLRNLSRFQAAAILGLSMTLSLPAWAGSGVKINVELNPAGSFVAESNQVNGSAMANQGGYSAKNVTLDLNTLKTGIDLRDTHMKTKYFETSNPKLRMAYLVDGTAKDGKFNGNLVVHGVSQPVTGTYEVKGKELVGKFKATLSQFKIAKASYMGVGVEDQVEVEVTLPIAGK